MELLTANEAATRLGITALHTRRLLRARKLIGIKFGREWIVDPQSVREFTSKRGRPRKPRKGG